MNNDLNPIWLGKNSRAQWDNYYGVAGDHYIASIVIADNPKDASKISAESENERKGYSNLSEDNFLKDIWTWEQIGLTDKDKQVLLYTFGAY